MIGYLSAVAVAVAVAMPCSASLAGELPAPKGEVVLTISGRIANSNAHERAEFDLAGLAALDATQIITATPWTDGPQTFVGVDLAKLMTAVGATGDTIIVTALNDYQVSVPLADFAAFHPILAYLMNGAPMPVSDKGPLFIVYPYDSDPQLRNDVFYTRSAWQVANFIVE